MTINESIRRLFEIQLDSLREYYGKRYESVLEECDERFEDDLNEREKRKRRIDQDATLADAAKRAKEGFEIAAKNAVPSVLKQDFYQLKGFDRGYLYETALSGLLRDMIQSTSSRQEIDDMWNDVNSEEECQNIDEATPEQKIPKPIKWYEKLFARCLVFGVNYLQGWLAWQSLRKTAANREKIMPKFPLF